MLYQNVRPSSLSEVVGNEEIVKALENIVKKVSEDRPHTFLFSGPSGCGKTTLARILASELDCAPESIIELNAANTRGIDTVRQLTETACRSSIFSENKVYIIDESHQLTTIAQQGLLKIIEDCPKKCYFIFCTTEPENLLKTILNRCTKFQVRSLKEDELTDLLTRVIEEQGLEVPSIDILLKIVEISGGCPREALNYLEQIVGIEDEAMILDILVGPKKEEKNIFDLSKLLALNPVLRRKKWKDVVRTFSSLEGDPEGIRLALLKILYNNLLRCGDEQVAKDTVDVMAKLSSTVIYGGRAQLSSHIMQCCFISDK